MTKPPSRVEALRMEMSASHDDYTTLKDADLSALLEVVEASREYLTAEKECQHGFPDASGNQWERAEAASARLEEALTEFEGVGA